MFDFDKWQEILQTISKHKLRTALTAFGVFWGIFMLVILMGAGIGLQNGVSKGFNDDALNSLWFHPGTTTIPHNGLQAGRKIKMTNADYDWINENIKEKEHISARFYPSGEFSMSYSDKSASFSVRAVHPGHMHLEKSIIEKGRFINEIDLKEKRKVTVLGELVAATLFEPDEEPIGKWIKIAGSMYKVVGVFSDEGGDWEMRRVYIPITTGQIAFNGQNRIHQLMFTFGDISLDESKVIEEKLSNHFSKIHNYAKEDRRAMWINNDLEEYERFQGVFNGIKLFVAFVSLGTIIAGVIGVSNIMLVIVKERTKEIGIRKALGATPGSIVSLIVQEAIVLTAVSGYMGLLFGISLLEGYWALITNLEVDTGFFGRPQIDFSIALTAVIVLTVCGALAGLIPALKAARVNPVVAMRAD